MTGLGNRRNYTHFGHLDPAQITFGNLLKGAATRRASPANGN